MATFDSLPNELLVRLLHLVPPQDLVHFACSQSRVYEAAQPFLKRHKGLHLQYYSIERPEANSIHFWRDLLRDVLVDPGIAYHINHVHIGKCISGFSDSQVEGEESISQSDLDLFRTALETSAFVPNSALDSWYDKIKRGDESPIIGLLLPLFPNLCKLWIETQLGTGLSCIHAVTTNIAKASQRDSANAFCRLSAVEFTPYQDDRALAVSLNYFRPFMALPSMRSIRAENASSYGFIQGRSFPISKVTDLNLLIGHITAQGLHDLIRGIKSLRHFEYTSFALGQEYEHNRLLAVLLEESKDSLEYLKIAVLNHSGGATTPSLQEFRMLREIHVNHWLLNAITDGSLAEVFPHTLEILRIEPFLGEGARFDVTSMYRRLLRMIQNKHTHAPHFRELRICYSSTASVESRCTLREACAAADIFFEEN